MSRSEALGRPWEKTHSDKLPSGNKVTTPPGITTETPSGKQLETSSGTTSRRTDSTGSTSMTLGNYFQITW